MLSPFVTTPLGYVIVALGCWSIGSLVGYFLGYTRGVEAARKYYRSGGGS
jgi:membrane protein YqaA with SNARE-associated domain